MRKFDIGGAINGEAEAAGKVERFAPCPRIRQGVDNDIEFVEIGQRRTAKRVIDLPPAQRDGQTVGHLEAPDRRNEGALFRDSLEEPANRLCDLIAKDPCERRRTVEDEAHGRPSSR